MNNQFILSELSALLVEVRNNPELDRAYKAQCADMYAETFVHSETETGAEILARMSPENFEEIKMELMTQLFSHELTKIHKIKKAKEALENPVSIPDFSDAMTAEEYNEEFCYDFDDEDSYQYYGYDEDEYPQFDYVAFEQSQKRLEVEIMTTVFGMLVNYKGEPEGECVVDSETSMRTFHGKYNYS